MCGICTSILISDRKDGGNPPHFKNCISEDLKRCLQRRGPDCYKEVSSTYKEKLDVFFCTAVLHLRGSELAEQPIIDCKGNRLLWNGEIFGGPLVKSKSECDTVVLAEKLFNAENIMDVLQTISSIEGPYAFIFYQANGLLWFGRDLFGRRSLLWNNENSTFQLCSVSSGNNWKEVPTTGIFCLDLNLTLSEKSFIIHHYAWSSSSSGLKQEANISDIFHITKIKSVLDFRIHVPITKALNRNVPSDDATSIFLQNLTNFQNCNLTDQELLLKLLDFPDLKATVNEFENCLSLSVKRRVENKLGICKECYFNRTFCDMNAVCDHASIGVLFSGGLDSIVIACLVDRHLPKGMPIDLINVAFGNAGNIENTKKHKVFNTPDRITGRSGLQELIAISPTRKWNFVEVNISKEELALNRKVSISSLLHPSCTVLDDSIGCALWFASQGKGHLSTPSGFQVYTSPARVLLVGMGADEQLAGYSRHRAKFKECGWSGLIDELSLELDRIGSRNLGRDDRIIADSGVESRYPFLDENVVSFLNALPVWLKANLHFPRGVGEKLLLRLLSYKLGLCGAAVLPKRAIQFGSRIAKIENTKEKASDVCVRLTSLKC